MVATILKLVGGIRGAILIGIILVLGGLFLWQRNAAQNAREDIETLKKEKVAVEVERDKAIEAARVNSETIDRLQQEKELINNALNTLAAAQNLNRTNAVTREVIIQREAALPANSAQAAPVLGTIITEIQTDRVRRRGQGASQ